MAGKTYISANGETVKNDKFWPWFWVL